MFGSSSDIVFVKDELDFKEVKELIPILEEDVCDVLEEAEETDETVEHDPTMENRWLYLWTDKEGLEILTKYVFPGIKLLGTTQVADVAMGGSPVAILQTTLADMSLPSMRSTFIDSITGPPGRIFQVTVASLPIVQEIASYGDVI